MLFRLIALTSNGSESILSEYDRVDAAVIANSRKCVLQWILLSVVIAVVLAVSRAIFNTIE